ncbi:head GIN domain-containing protein [Aquimarina sp. 2201CG5-10]|uniref:head GIN domain-containing protein n=1 Tax=Aquimarina callyspongiae TaxID=3098150 RepID=UPI002AB43C54|nr:head GIN domain-containing protein [Aquimarina sp. 2201CG5-10]MDY8135315.1 head GIN domain-containing protein [Aquimarina sp. 2201CG5-10]
MKKLVFVWMLCMGMIAQAQDVVTKNIGDFSELKVFDKIQVTLVQSDENKVEITGIKRRDVDIKQNNNILKIKMSLDNIWDNNNTEVVVYYKKIKKIDANEGSRVESDHTIEGNTLDLRVQEGASIATRLDINYLYAKAVTGGLLELIGSAEEQEVVINSGGQYYAKKLKTEDTQVKISAGGTAEVYASNYIKANTNAGGVIKIYGNPKEVDPQKILGGKIIEVN